MSLHSADYVRDLVGHVPDKMLCLRQDEVSVISRMKIQHTRRVSLPSRLSGITEREHSDDGGGIQEHSDDDGEKQEHSDDSGDIQEHCDDGGDIQESLNKSYIQMKTKLYELEEYNQKLEKQLSEIFSCISASVSKPPAQSVGKAGQQGKISPNTQTLPGATRTSYLAQEESHDCLVSPQGIGCCGEARDEVGKEEYYMKTTVDSPCFKLFQSLQSNSENFQSEFKTPEKYQESQQEMEMGFKKRRKFRSINLSDLVEESLETKSSNEELTNNNDDIKDDPDICELKKPTILHLEDEAAKIPRVEECEQDRANRIPLTQILSVSTIATSSHESLGISGYLSFHEESESVDEFFLFPEDVLNVNFETICEELALFSQDMGILLDLSNSSYLKAAKASHQGKTLWIYRGF